MTWTIWNLKTSLNNWKVASAYEVDDKGPDKSRCFGFLTMPNAKETQQAIYELHGYGTDDNILTVTVARESQT